MAEALGVAAAILQLVTFGLSAAQKLCAVADTLKSHASQIHRLARHVEQNSKLLDKLRKSLEQDHAAGININDGFERDILSTVDSCKDVLQRLQDAADLVKTNQRAAAWKLFDKYTSQTRFALCDEQRIDRFRSELSQCEITLQLMLIIHWRPRNSRRDDLKNVLRKDNAEIISKNGDAPTTQVKHGQNSTSGTAPAESFRPLPDLPIPQAQKRLLQNLSALNDSRLPTIADAVSDFLASLSIIETDKQHNPKNAKSSTRDSSSILSRSSNSTSAFPAVNSVATPSTPVSRNNDRNLGHGPSAFPSRAHSPNHKSNEQSRERANKSGYSIAAKTMWTGRRDKAAKKTWIFDRAPIPAAQTEAFVLEKASNLLDNLSRLDHTTSTAVREHVENLQETLLAIHIRRQRGFNLLTSGAVSSMNFVTGRDVSEDSERGGPSLAMMNMEDFAQGNQNGDKQVPNPQGRALANYQMQLMLIEQQNKRRLLMARQEQELIRGADSATPSRAAVQGVMSRAQGGAFPPQSMSPRRASQSSILHAPRKWKRIQSPTGQFTRGSFTPGGMFNNQMQQTPQSFQNQINKSTGGPSDMINGQDFQTNVLTPYAPYGYRPSNGAGSQQYPTGLQTGYRFLYSNPPADRSRSPPLPDNYYGGSRKSKRKRQPGTTDEDRPSKSSNRTGPWTAPGTATVPNQADHLHKKDADNSTLSDAESYNKESQQSLSTTTDENDSAEHLPVYEEAEPDTAVGSPRSVNHELDSTPLLNDPEQRLKSEIYALNPTSPTEITLQDVPPSRVLLNKAPKTKRVGRRRGPLRPDQRAQAAEIRAEKEVQLPEFDKLLDRLVRDLDERWNPVTLTAGDGRVGSAGQ